jgi:hypothetical protein
LKAKRKKVEVVKIDLVTKKNEIKVLRVKLDKEQEKIKHLNEKLIALEKHKDQISKWMKLSDMLKLLGLMLRR